MRIGIYDPYLDTVSGGERYMLAIAECLARKNDVDVFWDDEKIFMLAQVKLGIDLRKVKIANNVFSSKVPIIKRILDTANYNIIFFLSDGSIPMSFSKKLILHFQFPVEWVKVNRKIDKFKLSRVDSIICNSNYTKKYIDEKFGMESTVIYPPIDIKSLSSDNTRKENIILTVGRFSRLSNGSDFKKHSTLIDVFKKIIRSGISGYKFIIVTNSLPDDEPFLDTLEKEIIGFPITMLRNIYSGEIIDLYKKSKIYWHAAGFAENLETHPERAEHFGITTVEAMAAGCVPVVINKGGQKEIVSDGENGFLWNKTTELMDKTIALINNDKIWENLSISAKHDAKIFNKERFCKEINYIIDTV